MVSHMYMVTENVYELAGEQYFSSSAPAYNCRMSLPACIILIMSVESSQYHANDFIQIPSLPEVLSNEFSQSMQSCTLQLLPMSPPKPGVWGTTWVFLFGEHMYVPRIGN